MARPRTPSKILELRGAFRAHPERRREDATGSAPFDRTRPANLTEREAAAWNRLMERLPLITLYNTDEIGIAQMARILAALEDLPATAPEFSKLDAAFRAWAVQYCCTPQARTKGLASGRESKPPNPFLAFKCPGT